MIIDSWLIQGRELGASDLHLESGEPPILRLDGKLTRTQGEPLSPGRVEEIGRELAASSGKELGAEDLDFSFTDSAGNRQRVNIYTQQATRSIAIRFLRDSIPTVEELGLPPILNQIAEYPRGLVLVTGPTGSGKSTTLAAMLDHINKNRQLHILTMEDPIEYVHHNQRCMISQREIGRDVDSFAGALRAALRQDPDIILVGEMRDPETISAALTAAETGHFVLSTLHTTGAAKTIDRIIDSFPPHQQQQIRTQLATVLKAVISQQLLPKIPKGRVAVQEILLINDAVSNLIREGKIFQISSILQTAAKQGMVNMDASLAQMVQRHMIAEETAAEACINRDELKRYLGVRV